MRRLLIKWEETNNTGIAIIDEQHRGITSIINTFYYLVGGGKGDNALYMRIIDTISNYSSIHFATEEGMLEDCEYGDREQHKKLHGKLIEKMEKIKREVSKTNDPQQLFAFLKEWWIQHINNEDKVYVPHLLANSKHL